VLAGLGRERVKSRDPLAGGRRSSLRWEGGQTEYSGDPDEEKD
jgi:hypothetical protein